MAFLPALDSPRWQGTASAFLFGMRSVASTILTAVLFATYVGIGALAHDTHFSLFWALLSTALIWAGPAQIILLAALGSGATAVQAAIAVGVSGIRLFPMWCRCCRCCGVRKRKSDNSFCHRTSSQ